MRVRRSVLGAAVRPALYRAPMTAEPSVLALLSQTLVAYTIEVDNEIERRMPHFTLKYGSSNPGFGSPWLISSGFWFNFLRHIGPGMIAISDLSSRSGYPPPRVSSAVAGLVRWGYIVHHAAPNDSRSKPPKADWVAIPTPNGKRWHETFPEVIADVEGSWTTRYGSGAVSEFRAALSQELQLEGSPCAQFMPLLDEEHRAPSHQPEPIELEPLCLGSIISRVVLAQAYRIERDLPISLALSANIVRVAGDEGVLVRDIPVRSGVAKQEATTMTNFLVRNGHAVIEVDPKSKNAKRLRLTHSGEAASEAYQVAIDQWDPAELRRSVGALPTNVRELHTTGGWRRRVKAPDTLPHFPVVTGHGGYPDGS